MLTMLLPLEGSGWPPTVESFKSRPLFEALGDDWSWLNNHLVQAVVGALLTILFWLWVAKGQKVVPGKKQYLGEMAYNMIRNGIARDSMGSEWRKYLPLLISLITFILLNNLFGELFLFMFPTFSKIGYAYGLAIVVFVMYNVAGIRKWGLLKYLRSMTLPKGVPWPLWILIVPLEFLSNFITRPITLAMRLFANLFAGHFVIMIIVIGGTTLLTWTGSNATMINITGAVALVAGFALFALEILVAVLQAYVFTVLTAQYISQAVSEAH